MTNSDTRRRALHKLHAILSAFQQVSETLPMQVANTLVTVALNEGRSLREYQDLTGAPQSTMSRHLLDLGDRNRHRQPGFKLIQSRQDTDDWRKNVYTLSPKGLALINTLIGVLEG